MNKIEYLILSSKIDYSTDLICCEFEKRGLRYLRLNRDQFSNYNIVYSLSDDSLNVIMENDEYYISSDYVSSIYFRAPVFLRNTNKNYSLPEQVYKSQWSSFIRNLIVFESAIWMNHPVATYRAENKLYQLKVASRCSFAVPNTFIANSLSRNISQNNLYIVKSLDTALFYDVNQEMFTYSTKISGAELMNSELKLAPVIIQDYLQDKVDIRVTIIGDLLFAVDITRNGVPIDGDWRRSAKDTLLYRPINLPDFIQTRIRNTMKQLDLKFGGMDLALVNGEYYFIEVNPTGEWGWLVTSADLPIDKAIVDYLVAKEL